MNATDLDRLGRDAIAELHGAFEAKEFLDGDFHPLYVVGLSDQGGFLRRQCRERVQRIADEIGGRLVTRVEKENALMQQLGF